MDSRHLAATGVLVLAGLAAFGLTFWTAGRPWLAMLVLAGGCAWTVALTVAMRHRPRGVRLLAVALGLALVAPAVRMTMGATAWLPTAGLNMILWAAGGALLVETVALGGWRPRVHWPMPLRVAAVVLALAAFGTVLPTATFPTFWDGPFFLALWPSNLWAALIFVAGASAVAWVQITDEDALAPATAFAAYAAVAVVAWGFWALPMNGYAGPWELAWAPEVLLWAPFLLIFAWPGMLAATWVGHMLAKPPLLTPEQWTSPTHSR